MKQLVFGIGINDADYLVSPIINGKQIRCPFYQTWRNMLARCYSNKYIVYNPTYLGTTVCDQWRHFSVFKLWMQSQDWTDKEFDKDFLGDGMYS